MKQVVVAVLSLLLCAMAYAGEWTVGVLAMRGEANTRQQWQALELMLNQAIPEERFHIQPLDLRQMGEAVNQRAVQFLVTNPAQFVQLNSHYHLRWLASLHSRRGGMEGGNLIGSAILVRRDSEIVSPQDLIGKTVGAIDTQAFGGYLLGYKALNDAGLRPEHDVQLRFTGFPADALLYLLRERAIQAAIVPVCLLENMDEEGLINKAEFRPLLAKALPFPCVSSTDLYPNWSFAALPDVDNALVDRVARALLNAPEAAEYQWSAPASTYQVEALLREVNQHPEQRRLWLDIKSWLIQHQFAMSMLAIVLAVLTVNYVWVMLLVRRRGKQLEKASAQLHQQEQALTTARQMSVLGEMASGFAHELNQPLAAIRHYAQGGLIRLRNADSHHPLIPALEQIDAQAQRGGDTLNNLRMWVTPSQGIATGDWQSVAVATAANHVWHLLRMEQQYPQVRLWLDIDHCLTLRLPPVLLDQVLANLMLNAAQAGAQDIWLNGRCDETAVVLELQDNAGGMSDHVLRQAFTPFTTSKPTGMGLGLAICQRLMRQCGSDIALENRLSPKSTMGVCATLRFTAVEGENKCP